MPKSPGTRPELDLILDMFPDDASLIRRLFLADQSFRSACEDYAVAHRTHHRLYSEPASRHAPETEDYASVIAGLEAEIGTLIEDARKVHRL